MCRVTKTREPNVMKWRGSSVQFSGEGGRAGLRSVGGEPFRGSRRLKPEERCDLRNDWVVGVGAVVVNNY